MRVVYMSSSASSGNELVYMKRRGGIAVQMPLPRGLLQRQS